MADSGSGVILISPLLQEALSKATSFASGKASRPLPQVSFRSGTLKDKFEELVELLTSIQAVVEGAEDVQESDPAIRLWLLRLNGAIYDAVDVLDEVDYNVLEKVVGMRVREKAIQFQSEFSEIQVQEQAKFVGPEGKELQEAEILSQIEQEQEQARFVWAEGKELREAEILIQEQARFFWAEGKELQDAEILSQIEQEQMHTSFFTINNLTVDFDQNMIHRFATINESLSKIREKIDFIEMMIKLGKESDLAIAKPGFDSFHSVGNLKNVVGRENEVSEILSLLKTMRDQHRISGISIVGMTGIGKTTVASLIYRKAKKTELYDVVAWVSASEDFNDERILKEMLDFLDFGALHAKGKGKMDEMLQYLSKKLEKKTFLLILDDLWGLDAGKWNVFVGHLSKIVDLHDGRCSIVLTTQSKSVASVTAEEKLFSMHKHEMRLLSDDECWSIIKKTVFRSSFSIQSDLEVIGKEIAQWCGGLPLVAVFIGETLSHLTEIDEWMAIKKNKSWFLNSEDGNKILSVLKSRSFDRLSSPLKKCFSYCSIYPKGSIIERDDLVLLWMAQGFLHQPNGSSMTLEDVGNEYFSDLLSDYFFQNEVRDSCGNIKSRKMRGNKYLSSFSGDLFFVTGVRDSSGNIITFKMHGIMHELALFVSRGETLICDARCSFDGSADIRHLGVEQFPSKHHDASIPREVVQRVRSLFWENHYIPYPKVSEFRSSRCLKLGDYGKFYPFDLKKLKYLKYLSISDFSFKMSKSFPVLYNLETLKLIRCHKLTTLRIGLSIKNLKVFCCYDLTSIQSIGELASLQSFELSCCYQLKSIPTELGSCISLKNLRIDYCPELTSIPKMRRLLYLESLEIRSCLSLTSLTAGSGSLKSLKNLRYDNCPKLTSIPIMRGLSSLESLEISNFTSLTGLTGGLASLNSLKNLIICNCDELESLSTELGSCISLQKLIIKNCPRVEYIPKDMKKLPSLVCLEISECTKLSSIPEEWLGSLTSLTELTLGPFWEELEEFPGLTYLQNTIKTLNIVGWPKLKSLPPQLEQLTALKELEMMSFDQVEVLPEWLGNLSSLRRLEIGSFSKLRQLPSVEAMQRLSNLQNLHIWDCQQYKHIYNQESSPEFSKVSHIAEKLIY